MSQTQGGIAVDVAADPAGATVKVAGDLDLSSAQQFMDSTLSVPERYSGSELTVDMTAVGFCDSAGLAALIKLRKRCDEVGWRLRTVNLQPALRRIVVDFSGLGNYLNVQ
jgi:anti-anti-sigma factor